METNQSEVLREQARSKHMAGETAEAIGLLTQAIKQDPANTRVAMDMVQIFIDINELEQAKGLFNQLPEADRESDTGKVLLGQLSFCDLAAKTQGKVVLQQQLDSNPQDYEAHFDLAICLFAENDYQQAVESLLIIMKSEPDFKEGAARELIITATDMLAPNDPELAQSFRRRLANILA